MQANKVIKMRVIRGIGQGALAGLIGAAVMHGFRLCWEARVDSSRHAVFGFDHEADVNAARLVWFCISRENLTEERAAQLGLAMHYALGAMIGSFYAGISAQRGWSGKASGTLLGCLLWLCADEIPISISGISQPFQKSIASHAGALAAHLLFGVTVENALRFRDEKSKKIFERHPLQAYPIL